MKIKHNYIYFAFFFLSLSFLHLHHLFLLENEVTKAFLIFSFGSLSQIFLETLLVMFIASVLSRFCSKTIERIFIVTSFFLLLIHLVEVPLVRLMDLTVWFAIGFLLDETWSNFLEMIYASNVSIKIWILSACGFVALFILGIWASLFSEKISQKKPFQLSLTSLGGSCCFATLLFLGWDAFKAKSVPSHIAERYERALPWKTSFFSNSYEVFDLPGKLKPLASEAEIFKKLDSQLIAPQKTPDLFLFVIESLREDFLDHQIAPHLHAFKTQNEIKHLSFSNANASQNSWFSIFHSQYPFYWGKAQYQWKQGALPLHILKKMGYKIHVYTSSRLSFYQMKDFLFGKNAALAETFNEFLPTETKETWKCDGELIATLNHTLVNSPNQGGRLFIIFLESTHFDYSWPPEHKTPFSPVIAKIDHLRSSFLKPDLEPIKNRYRNSIHYIDRLIGTFQETLSATDNREAVVVITGDHGEEFFEEGHLFHASNLNEVQTRVPIYYNLAGLNSSLTSHMDIFPTLLHYVAGEDQFGDFFNGHSLLKSQHNPFIIAGRYNASRCPSEFFIHNGKTKMRARFAKPNAIFECNQLHILPENEKLSLPEEFISPLNTLFAH